jgi:hypothetical protein
VWFPSIIKDSKDQSLKFLLVVPFNILHPSSPKEEESWAQIEAEECEPGTPFRFQLWNQLRATH